MTKRTGVEIVGKKFGRLTVVNLVGVNKHKHSLVELICECGSTTIAEVALVKSGNTRSCGCLRRRPKPRQPKLTDNLVLMDKQSVGTYPKRKSSTYASWKSMLERCYSQNSAGYKNYGGRGIGVCLSWRSSFSAFVADMGQRPESLTLDRIDGNGDYCKDNCRWASREDQANNKRTNVTLSWAGQTRTLAQWARVLGVDPTTLGYRFRAGWPVSKILGEPPRRYRAK